MKTFGSDNLWKIIKNPKILYMFYMIKIHEISLRESLHKNEV